jgi:hypothetical protein
MVGPHIWYEALASKLGVIVHTSDSAYTKFRLEQIRAELNDPDLANIEIRSRSGTELWLIKRPPDASEDGIPT